MRATGTTVTMAVLVGTVCVAGGQATARPSASGRHVAATAAHGALHTPPASTFGRSAQFREARSSARVNYAAPVRYATTWQRNATTWQDRGSYAPRSAGLLHFASYASPAPMLSVAAAAPVARSVALPPMTETDGGWSGGSVSCVPYARSVTGMAVEGNALAWWSNAAGIYARGARPEPGAVLNFRASGGMSMGHVAVVRDVLSPRELRIDHANWGGPGIRRGSVMHDVRVVDVSAGNDWSAVRVQVGHDDELLGRTYPTYGFIYNRPDNGVMLANRPERSPVMTAGYRATMPGGRYDEVAEAPASGGRR